MRKSLIVWGLSAGAILIAGGGIYLYTRSQAHETPTVYSNGGSVALDTNPTPSPSPDPLALHVAAANPSSVQGGNQPTGGENQPTPTPAGLPGPAQFKQYDQYKSSTGALYGDIATGQGAAVAAGKLITVAYRGWLTDGTLFDESYSGGKPFSFTEGQHRVIPGWEQGLFGMKVGGKRRLIVPPSAGYGADAHGPIPGGSVLVFDVELLDVK